jgi:glutathione S-transferase
MRLRHSPASPFVRKVLVVAHELGCADRIEIETVSRSATYPYGLVVPENPLAKIPALVTDDGVILFDSRVICEYLDTLAGGGRLCPAEGAARWTALRQQALGDGIADAVILAAYEQRRPQDRRWSGWTDAQMLKVQQGLGAAEAEDLAGPLRIGQVAIACAISYLDLRFPEDGWRGRHPKLAAWYRDVEQLASMQATRLEAR